MENDTANTTNNGFGNGANGGLSMFGAMINSLQNLEDSPLAQQLLEQLQHEDPTGATSKNNGVSQEYLDSLERYPKKRLLPEDSCAICTGRYLDDPYPLVVELPCQGRHRFDLECIGPWLKLHATCPLCRQNLLEKKKQTVVEDDDDEEEWDDTYGWLYNSGRYT